MVYFVTGSFSTKLAGVSYRVNRIGYPGRHAGMKTSLCVKLYNFVEAHDENARSVSIDSIICSCINVI